MVELASTSVHAQQIPLDALILTVSSAASVPQVSRGLFEEHKLLFSFLLTTAKLRDSGDISAGEWNFLLRGVAGVVPDGGPVNPLPEKIEMRKWKEIQYLQVSVGVRVALWNPSHRSRVGSGQRFNTGFGGSPH